MAIKRAHSEIDSRELAIEEFFVNEEPFYVAVADEIELFDSAYRLRLPIMLKGPTGCGKTRFLAHMAWRLSLPLVTIACHEDLTASDLVGRFLLKGHETTWSDGPLSLAVKHGAICYLDEVVEARKDTTVVIHPLTDDRRMLPQEKKGVVLEAHPNFLLVISYNPGYQSVTKDLKQSTRQRFVAIDFNYPPAEKEQAILMSEGGVDRETAVRLVRLGEMVRNLRQHGLEEGVSTRLLVYAAKLISAGHDTRQACTAAVTQAMTDDPEMQETIDEIVSGLF
ncbi:CbbQ/NirQ/NorQ/GpvN family protein [Desulfomonile tiedjei]|uniref:MoxR-like ATPase n=1 Tax=Desulfomonile tiedjei (strain ATCC 49306 / DSM 6799 / DCB-1) TaxID=706587 RepID=I4C219_DESTA|nr:CbbQ/NirQ/NorQ/GpvN family protein [Desulfomonile tiedjei]AFM23610.1 MoxR-like ATPase [Desulfomonile tiedjei DSM 6799]